jgi:phospholipase C
MHPAVDAISHGVHVDLPSSLLSGEVLLQQIYDAVRTSSTSTGSHFANTLLLITFDEHGGTYDHVPPPLAPPPDPAAPAGQMGFTFQRSGVRIPAIAISAYLDEGTVVSEEYRSTSLLRTLRERWPLGSPLTGRDAVAPEIAPLLTRSTPRRQEDWPVVIAQPAPGMKGPLLRLNERLNAEGRAILSAALALEALHTGQAPPVNVDDATGKEAVAILDQLQAAIFPGITGRRTRRGWWP